MLFAALVLVKNGAYDLRATAQTQKEKLQA